MGENREGHFFLGLTIAGDGGTFRGIVPISPGLVPFMSRESANVNFQTL